MKYERRYHATHLHNSGLSPLARLGVWMTQNPNQLDVAPRILLVEAAIDVLLRLPLVAAREPTRRHRRHFAWLLRWHALLIGALDPEIPTSAPSFPRKRPNLRSRVSVQAEPGSADNAVMTKS